jgi:hypothetical protein
MSVSERWPAMEQRWESILSSGGDIRSPDRHGEIGDERRKLIESGKAEFMTLEELRQKLGLPPQ